MKTNYTAIKEYSEKLQELLKEHGMPLGLKQFPLTIKMDVDPHAPHGIGRLIKDTGCKRIMAVLGVDEHNKFTISFVALDAHDKVDPRHHTKNVSGQAPKAIGGAAMAAHTLGDGDPTTPTGPIDGEETWPPDDVDNDGSSLP